MFDLWDYASFVTPLQVALAEEDSDACIPLLRKLLNSVNESLIKTGSPLFYCIQSTKNQSTANQLQILPAILSEIEKDSRYDFLKENESFQKLINEYKLNDKV